MNGCFTDGDVVVVSVKYLMRETERQSEFVFVWWTKSEGLSRAGRARLSGLFPPQQGLFICLLLHHCESWPWMMMHWRCPS